MLPKLVVLASIVFAAVLGFGCSDNSPSAPTPITSPVTVTPPPAPPSPTPAVSPLVGIWHLTVRVTEVNGTGCVADTMRSQIGARASYSLSVTQKDSTMTVTLKSSSGEYACTFTPVADSSTNGFTTFGQGGFYTCEHFLLPFRCSDGTPHTIFSFGEDISGRPSGTGMTGAWQAVWFDGFDDYSGVDMKAEFTGIR